MKRRLIAAVAAVLSAAIGAGLLFSYVAGADRRAMAGLQTSRVLVAAKDVPAGTSAGDLRPYVVVKTLPALAVTPGAVADLSELTGLVAAVDLKAGEQIIAARFTDPASLAGAARPKVADGMQELTLQLEPQRVLGGDLAAGDFVGVYISVDKQTHLALSSVQVSQVVGGSAGESNDGGKTNSAGNGTVQVTLLATPADAEKIVFGAENGTVWLSHVNQGSRASGTKIITGENVFS